MPFRPCHHHSLLIVEAGEHIDIAVFAPEGIQCDRELGSRGAGGFLGKVGLTLLLQSILGCPQVLKFLCRFLAHQMGAESPNTVITVVKTCLPGGQILLWGSGCGSPLIRSCPLGHSPIQTVAVWQWHGVGKRSEEKRVEATYLPESIFLPGPGKYPQMKM